MCIRDRLMDKRQSADEVHKLLAEEIQHLEEEVAARVDHIKSLAKKL